SRLFSFSTNFVDPYFFIGSSRSFMGCPPSLLVSFIIRAVLGNLQGLSCESTLLSWCDSEVPKLHDGHSQHLCGEGRVGLPPEPGLHRVLVHRWLVVESLTHQDRLDELLPRVIVHQVLQDLSGPLLDDLLSFVHFT